MHPSGIFFTRYAADLSLVRTRWQLLSLVLVVLVLLALPAFVGGRWVNICYSMFITAIAVMGLQICTGYAGQINPGQSAFMGVGAFGCAIAP